MAKAFVNKRDKPLMDNAFFPDNVNDTVDLVAEHFDELLEDHADKVKEIAESGGGGSWTKIGELNADTQVIHPTNLGDYSELLIVSNAVSSYTYNDGIAWDTSVTDNPSKTLISSGVAKSGSTRPSFTIFKDSRYGFYPEVSRYGTSTYEQGASMTSDLGALLWYYGFGDIQSIGTGHTITSGEVEIFAR